jgi:REP element-mobilizing transposase RayT
MFESKGYQILDQSKTHYITSTVIDWVDVFTTRTYNEIVIDSMKYCIANKGMNLYGFVIMSSQIHLIIQSRNGRLSDLLRDFKKFTAKTILETIENSETENRKDWILKRFEFACKSHTRNEQYQFWQHGKTSETIYSEEYFLKRLEYIHQIPVRKGIVSKPEDYIYSSASEYIKNKNLIQEFKTN